ncbi:MAG: serine/threonine-protein kinase [Byssovorax sp.]
MDVPSHPPDPPALPASLGEFTIVGPLGEGGSGVVYAVTRAGAALALKVLRPDLELSAREMKAFLAEAERMRRVAHPSLVPVIDAGTLPDGRPFLAMPHLRGESLAQRLTRGALPALHALALFDGLAGAVAALHAAGLVHRDIKPENIFLLEGGERLVLLDLGIAREIDAPASTTTQAGMVRGTPAYMAPERFFGSPASVGTDLYELAVVLYLMLVGRLPWDSVHDAKGRMFPRRPADAGVQIPEPLAQALIDALSTNADLRPASVPAFVERIRRATDEPGIGTAPTLLAVLSSPSTPPARAAQTAPPPAPTLLSGQRPPGALVPQKQGVPVVRHLAIALGVAAAIGTLITLRWAASPRTSSKVDASASSAAIVDAGAIEAPSSIAAIPASAVDAPVASIAAPPAASAAVVRPPPLPLHSLSTTSPVATATATAAPVLLDLPQCRKLLALYCSPEFKATDAGGQCLLWQPTWARYLAAPPEGRPGFEEGCQIAYAGGVIALKERQRQIDAGLHP